MSTEEEVKEGLKQLYKLDIRDMLEIIMPQERLTQQEDASHASTEELNTRIEQQQEEIEHLKNALRESTDKKKKKGK